MRSKRRIFAWLLTVVMVMSLMSNQYMIVTKAEESSTAYSIAEALALESTKEVVVDGETTSVEVNKVSVSLPQPCWDEVQGDYIMWNDKETTLYKLTVPANSAVKLTYEYTGEIVGPDGDRTSHQVEVYNEQEVKYISAIVNTSDKMFGATSQSYVIPNETDADKTFLVVLDTDESNTTALTATSPISYIMAPEISEGDIAIEGDSYVIQYPMNGVYNNIINGYKDGYVYKFTVPQGESYSIKLKYVGQTEIESVAYMDINQMFTNESGGQYLSSITSCSIGSAQPEGTLTLGTGDNYIFLSSDHNEWDNVQVTLSKLENISVLKDDAVVLSGVGEYSGEITEKEYGIEVNSSGKGTLYAITLQPNSGYKLNYENNVFYVFREANLGETSLQCAYDSAAIYNGLSEPETYYVWTTGGYDADGNPLPLVVSDINYASSYESTKLTADGAKVNIVSGNEEVVYLYDSCDSYGKDITVAETVNGSIYSIEIPAYSKYMLTLDYVGDDYVDDYYTIGANVNILNGDYSVNAVSVSNQHDTWSDYYYNTNTVALDNSYNGSSQVVYLLAGGQWEEGDIQVSITEYPNITQLMSDAEDITGKTSYTGAISDSNYEFVWDVGGNKGDMRGGLQKVTVPAGKTRYYNVSFGFQGVIYKDVDGALLYDSPIYGTDFSVTNPFAEDAVYYIWLYTYDYGVTSYDITLIQDITYRTHVETYGWQDWNNNGAMAGTTGQEKRLEGFEIKLVDDSMSGGVRYTAHVQTYGWLAEYTDPETWTTMDGDMCGTSGEQKRIEAICIDLYGDVAEKYDVYYRVSTHKFGWLDWAKNGERAGTAGFATAIEAMQVVMVPKGGSIDSSYGGITTNLNMPYAEYGIIPSLSQLTTSAIDVSEVGSYTATLTDAEYYYNNYTQHSIGALLKVTVPSGENRVIGGTGTYETKNAYAYDETNVEGNYVAVNFGKYIALGNNTDAAKTYYVWVDGKTNMNGEFEPVAVEVTKADMVSECATTALSFTESTVVTATKTQMGYLSRNNYGGETLYNTYVIDGAAYYVDIPANSVCNLKLDYVGETTTGYWNADYNTSRIECLVQDAECVHEAVIEVSKYSDYPNYSTGGTGLTSSAYLLTNDTDEVARYYFIVTNVENQGDVELSVNEVASINTLVDSALDITEYDTYQGEFSVGKYAVPLQTGITTEIGTLVKQTLAPGESIDVALSANVSMNRYELVDGELKYINTYTYRNTITNNRTKTVTYYYWLHSGYDDIKAYTATVGAPFFKELAELEGVATPLIEGDNSITKSGDLVGLKVAFLTWNEEIQDTEIISFNESGYIYKFNAPAMSEVTIKLTEGLDSDNVDIRIFDGFDAETQSTELMSPSLSQYGDQTTYTCSNVSREDKNIAIFLPEWRDECGINISVEPLLPEDDGTLYIYSWNDEISSRIAGVLDANPEYKEKIKCINFNISGTGDEYINTVKTVLEVTKDTTAIVVMDIDVVSKLKSEAGFANLQDIGFDTALYDNAYDYTVEMGTYNDELKFVTYEAHPGGFIYNMDIAKEVLGTSDPDEVQALIGDPEKFLAVAQQMKEAGYYMTSGEDTIENLGRYTFNEDEAKKLSQSLKSGKYTTGNRSWSVGWTEDMMSGEVFGFFASPWFVYWTFQYTDIPVAICEGPVYYPWGGCFLGVSSDGDNENDALAAEFLELLCCDEEVIYNNTTPYISDTNGGVAFPNNQKVVERFISEDIGYTTEYNENATITNNPMPVWHNAASRIGKGEWESKCTDKKYIVTVDSKKQINLSPDSEAGKALLEAGFVYENFTKLAEVDANASFDDTTGILTVDDVKKVVRYIYTENGVSRELQFIACMEEDTSVKVEEDVVEETDESGEVVSKTTTFIEVDAENGEIVGQIDEVEVKTEDENTTIVVTENKDIMGEVVEDASITVSQETISESTLDQSIDVAVEKNGSYAQAAEEDETIEEKVEIKEIKAEFKDDSANTEVSKDLINKLQDNDISLEISKKNDKGDVEYSWHFDRNSMKDVDKEKVKPVNTKVTIHTDSDLKGYDKDKKDKIDKLTKKDDSEKPVEKSVIAFDHNGELPGKTTVTLNVGDKYEEGSYVYYYHYDDKDKDNPKLVPKGRGKVKDGYVPVRIDHCSDYVITNEVLAKAESATLSIGSEVLGESTTLETGDIAKLTCTVAPEAAMQEVTYSSSDTRVLAVDENGNIEAVAEGTATIIATANDDSGVSVSVTITVKNPIHLIARITLDKTAIELEGGETAIVNAKIIPEIATDKTVTWSSEDESVAVVDESGKITALKEGTTTITVTANDEGKKSASCKVTVTKSVIEVTELKLDSTAVELDEGEDVTFTVTVLPEEATIKDVIWTSSDETVATVDATGKVTAVKEGTATITAQATDGSKKSVSCEITVKKPIVLVTEIKLDNASLSLEEGASKAITATVKPTDATDKTITWKSSDEAVATVDSTGKVTAVKEGTATITAQAADESKVTAECKVTVSKKVIYATEVSISNSSLSLVEGETSALTAKVAPSNATNNAVNWSSNNTSVATVDKNGKVTAIKAGVAVITATAADGSGKTASCKLTVVEPEPAAINVYYRTHIQTFGWEGEAGKVSTWKKNGAMSGTSGKSKRLEGIEIEVASAEAGKDVDLGIQYTTHCQSYGWLPWSAAGEMSGTSGESKRLEAIMIQLTGADADKYDVYYRVHAQSNGWLGWAKNGEPSGTAGYGKRLEGIQIVVVKKGEKLNVELGGIKSDKTEAYIAKKGSSPVLGQTATQALKPVVNGADAPYVMYKTHVQSYGWQQWVLNGAMSGTSGKAKRLEGINIKLSNMPYEGDIVYTTHVQKYGWKDGKPDADKSTWKKNGEMSGTSGEAKRLEAICIDLTGEMAEHYDIYYRVHAQTFGWLGWAKNGEESGTAGYAKRLEGIQIVLVPKGGEAPGKTYGGITSKNDNPFIEKK